MWLARADLRWNVVQVGVQRGQTVRVIGTGPDARNLQPFIPVGIEDEDPYDQGAVLLRRAFNHHGIPHSLTIEMPDALTNRDRD